MKRKIFTAALIALILHSCGSTERIPYLVKAERLQLYELEQFAKIYEAKIMAKDVLTISVNTTVRTYPNGTRFINQNAFSSYINVV